MLNKLLEEKRKAEESIIKYENSLISSMPHQMSDCFIEDIFLAGFDCFENFCLKLYQENFHVSFYKKLLSYDDNQKITIEKIQKSNLHRFVSSKSETFKKSIVNNIIISKIQNKSISIHEVEHLIDYLKISDNTLLNIFHKKLKKFSLKYFSERKLLHKLIDEQPLDFDIKHIYPQIHQEFINLKQDEKDNYFIRHCSENKST